MTFKPAHKEVDDKHRPGQIVNRPPEQSFDRYPYLKHSTADQTLGDYISRKNYHDAFDRVAEEMGIKRKASKLTFDEWLTNTYGGVSTLPTEIKEFMIIAWKAGQQNA